MKKIIVFISSALISLSFISAQNTINIKTNKEDAAIFVNDSLIGKGNTSVELLPGKHEIKIRSDLKSWNAQTIIDSISVSTNSKPIRKEYSLENFILLDTNPQDAYVYSGDSLIANTPAFIPIKLKQLTLQKPNYETSSIQLNSIASNKVNLDFTGELKEKRFTESVWFKVLLGSAVALGTTAAYFKIKADNKFEDYEENRDPVLLDDIDRYDLYSGIAFGALQVNFGMILYLFLTD